jgi:hypothetical protein
MNKDVSLLMSYLALNVLGNVYATLVTFDDDLA